MHDRRTARADLVGRLEYLVSGHTERPAGGKRAGGEAFALHSHHSFRKRCSRELHEGGGEDGGDHHQGAGRETRRQARHDGHSLVSRNAVILWNAFIRRNTRLLRNAPVSGNTGQHFRPMADTARRRRIESPPSLFMPCSRLQSPRERVCMRIMNFESFLRNPRRNDRAYRYFNIEIKAYRRTLCDA